jgi:ribosomal protein S18 acetylase RimI-like enzyme
VGAPRVWLADFDEAEAVAGLLVEFRDWYGRDWPSDNAFLASVERLIEDRRATEFLLGAPHDDAPPSGVVQLRYRFSVWTAADDCWLEDLWVREDARGTGLGRALVHEACRRAAERGCRRIELDVSDANAPALGLYESLGFATGKLPGTRDLFLQKRL